MKLKLFDNDYVIYLPHLVIYILICLFKQNDFFVGDEERYVRYAENILNGFYASTQFDDSFLWNGPGYPLFLTLFKILKVPLLYAKLFNSLFLYLGLIFLYKTLKKYLNIKKAFIVTSIFGLYYPLLQISIPYILTEAISFFLVTFFSYHVLSYSKTTQNKNKWLAAVTLGFLILTKVIFAYVLVTLLIIVSVFYCSKETVLFSKKYIPILIIAFCITIPYQVYTYSITKKLFYFSDSGGSSLYWISTPYENEYGDWHNIKTLHEKPEIYKNHKEFLLSIQDLSHIEKDNALKGKAINNIKNHKQKFLNNWVNNIRRLFFNYPYTIENPKLEYTLRIYAWKVMHNFFGLILFIGIILSTIISIKYYREIEDGMFFLCSFLLIYLGGISLLSAYPRFLYIMLPCIIIQMTYNYSIFKSNSK